MPRVKDKINMLKALLSFTDSAVLNDMAYGWPYQLMGLGSLPRFQHEAMNHTSGPELRSCGGRGELLSPMGGVITYPYNIDFTRKIRPKRAPVIVPTAL